jgi:hypothetical protein
MTTIAIIPESSAPAQNRYRAVAGLRQSVGRTPGEALDTITAQLDERESGTLIVIQQMRPDEFFAEAQRIRLSELMDRWRAARDRGDTLPVDEQSELDRLVATELEAATRRSASLLRELRP